MFGIAAIVAFALALILRLADIAKGTFVTWQTFALTGLLCLAVFAVAGWWPIRRAP